MVSVQSVQSSVKNAESSISASQGVRRIATRHALYAAYIEADVACGLITVVVNVSSRVVTAVS